MGCKVIIKCDHRDKRPKHQARRVQFFSVQLDRFTIIEGDIMAIMITDTQQFTLTAQGVDKKGKPAPLDGAVSFVASDANLLTSVPVTDLSTTIGVGPLTGVTLPVTAQVTATGDADLGAGT